MARRQFSHQVSDEVYVAGWNAHQYGFKHTSSPAHVSIELRRFGNDDGYASPDFATTMRFSPARARQLATALVAAADEAEQAPPTDDTIVPPGASDAG